MRRRGFLQTFLTGAVGAGAVVPGMAQFGGFDPLKKLQNKAQNKVERAVTGQSDDGDSTTKLVKGATGIGAGEEATIGAAVSTDILGTYGELVRDDAIMRRVNLMGRTLAMFSERPSLTWRFGVFNNDQPNAFSAPGGYVFISKGAYDTAATDDQLAGVLAHEIIHVSHRHALRIISRNEFISGAVDLGGELGGVQTSAGPLKLDKVCNTLLKGGYDHGCEYEADKCGAELAYNTGYAKDGLVQFLQKLATRGESRGGFKTHPPLGSRIGHLEGKD